MCAFWPFYLQQNFVSHNKICSKKIATFPLHLFVFREHPSFTSGTTHNSLFDTYFLNYSLRFRSTLITDRARSTREGNVFSLFTPREGYPGQVRRGGRVPQPGLMGVPRQGVPHLGYPPSDLARGYPT